ncbi:hypothetical protein [Spirosoma radiotolerans]|uniref:Uncharacterized protein n=1 Tax=Spirosoma radiotolerans TaxID=1379870 RepID=A0A0E3ZUQ5_9BACT|nr:hypothetical protein [Spirosoma radiotolerans]AKD54590.1 hypothetical protein SD10_06375 [Spirosoma radiotolerans]
MNKLFLLLALTGLFSCQPEDQPADVAARASGAYVIQSYVVNGDTVYSTSGINKLGVSNFSIRVGRKASDTVAVEYAQNRSTLPVANFSNIPVTGTRIVYIEEKGGKFQLSSYEKAPFVYESSIDGNRFYERTVGYNVDSLEARWRFDSLKSPYTPPLREIIISAQK